MRLTANVDRRIAELNAGAGVIGRWALYGHVIVNDMKLVEAKAHQRLQEYKIQDSVGTEIFSCVKELAARAVLETAATAGTKIYEDCFPKTEKKETVNNKSDDNRLEIEKKMECAYSHDPRALKNWVYAVNSLKARRGFEKHPLYYNDIDDDLRRDVYEAMDIIDKHGLSTLADEFFKYCVGR